MHSETIINCCRVRPEADADIPLPKYMTPHSAGMDICAAVEAQVTLNPGDIKLVPTGFAISMPVGFEAQIRPRSGLAVKHGIGIINSPGTIDADYRGEIGVILVNLSNQPFTVRDGDRIAQLVIAEHAVVEWNEVTVLEDTTRGAGGFGSTGL